MNDDAREVEQSCEECAGTGEVDTVDTATGDEQTADCDVCGGSGRVIVTTRRAVPAMHANDRATPAMRPKAEAGLYLPRRCESVGPDGMRCGLDAWPEHNRHSPLIPSGAKWKAWEAEVAANEARHLTPTAPPKRERTT